MTLTPARAGLSLLSLTLLAACDVPTGVPYYDTQWNVPGKSTTISVNKFLPAGVSVGSDSSVWQVAVSPATASFSRSLGQDCAACAAANGFTIPKPAFTGGGSTTMGLPSSVATATLVRDTLTVTITNGYTFDPIRPSATARGYFTILVSAGSTVIGRDSVDGATTAMPPGGTVTRKIALSGSAGGTLTIASTLSSPAGDPATMNASATLTVSGSIGTLKISGATVNLASQAVTSDPTDIDLSNVGSSISNHTDGGSLYLTITNPFGVSGGLTVTLASGQGAAVTKSIQLAAGTSTPTITFTKQELDALLGSHVAMTFSGNVSGSGVTVQPGQSISVSSRLEVNVSTGSNP